MTAIDNQNPDQQYDLERNKLQGQSESYWMVTVEAQLGYMINIQKETQGEDRFSDCIISIEVLQKGNGTALSRSIETMEVL